MADISGAMKKDMKAFNKEREVAASELDELLCGDCDGNGRLRNNKWKNGVYTFGFIECGTCGGTGIEPHNDRTQAKPKA